MGIHITNVDEKGDSRYITDLGIDVAHGETVEIEDDDIAENLLRQQTVWKRATTKAAKAAANEADKAEHEENA